MRFWRIAAAAVAMIASGAPTAATEFVRYTVKTVGYS